MENRETLKQASLECDSENSAVETKVAAEAAEAVEDIEDVENIEPIETVETTEATESTEATPPPTGTSETSNEVKPAGFTESEIAQILMDLSEAQERAAKLTEDRKLIYDQLMRRQAEFENFRKRIDRERTETHARARADIVTELLPVLDNLERALQSSRKQEAGESILEGVKLIHRQFLDVLGGLGLSPVKAVGEPFDPHMHEAVTTEPTDEHPENTVLAELQRGYMLGERLLRPAMVKVAVKL